MKKVISGLAIALAGIMTVQVCAVAEWIRYYHLINLLYLGVIKDLDEFKTACDVIVANRYNTPPHSPSR